MAVRGPSDEVECFAYCVDDEPAYHYWLVAVQVANEKKFQGHPSAYSYSAMNYLAGEK